MAHFVMKVAIQTLFHSLTGAMSLTSDLNILIAKRIRRLIKIIMFAYAILVNWFI